MPSKPIGGPQVFHPGPEKKQSSVKLQPCYTCGHITSLDGTANACVRCLKARVSSYAWIDVRLAKLLRRALWVFRTGRGFKLDFHHAFDGYITSEERDVMLRAFNVAEGSDAPPPSSGRAEGYRALLVMAIQHMERTNGVAPVDITEGLAAIDQIG